jgi:hypothetical protein
MKGLLKKSLISVADAVSTIFLPNAVAKPISSLRIDLMIVHTPFKNYYRLHGDGKGRIIKTDSFARFFITQRFVKSEFILDNYQLCNKINFH